MKNTLLLLFVFYSFLCNAQRTFFKVNNNYVGPIGATISATNGLIYLTSTSGQSGGKITSDGGNIITAKGVVWSKSSGPTIALSTKTNDGSGVGTCLSKSKWLLLSMY